MRIDDLIERARSGRTVYTEPYERDGVTVIPAARVVGGLGGGVLGDRTGRHADGAGGGVIARPVGAFVVRGGSVRWHPAVDVNRLVSTIGAVAVGGLLAAMRLLRARDRDAG